MLPEADRPVRLDDRLGEVALLVLDRGEGRDALAERRPGLDPLVELPRTRSPDWRRRAWKICSIRASPPTAPMAARSPAASPS